MIDHHFRPKVATVKFKPLGSGSACATLEFKGQTQAYTILGTDEQMTSALLGLILEAKVKHSKVQVRVTSDPKAPATLALSRKFAEALKSANA
jgi:hypothetical protein